MSGKQGDFLGQVVLGWQDLDLVSDEGGRELDLPLGVRPEVSAREQGLVQGTIQLLVEAPKPEVCLGRGGGGGACSTDHGGHH